MTVPPRIVSLLLSMLFVLSLAPRPTPALAAAGAPLNLFDKPSIGWLSVRNMTVAARQAYFDQQADAGWLMIDAERIEISGKLRVSLVWQRNTDNRSWASRSNLTDTQFDTFWKQYTDAGIRLIDQDAYTVDGAVRCVRWPPGSLRDQAPAALTEQLAKLADRALRSAMVPDVRLGAVDRQPTAPGRGECLVTHHHSSLAFLLGQQLPELLRDNRPHRGELGLINLCAALFLLLSDHLAHA